MSDQEISCEGNTTRLEISNLDCEERSGQQLLNGEFIGRKNRTAAVGLTEHCYGLGDGPASRRHRLAR
jgi:hypothetical protein